MPKFRSGWKKDKFDRRDWLRGVTVRGAISDRKVFDLSVIPTIPDQGYTSSCVGQAMDGARSCQELMSKTFVESFSAWDIYKGALFLEGENENYGCYPRDALEWQRTKGTLLERFWPFIDGTKTFDKKFRSSDLDKEAMKFPLSYFRVVDGIDGICAILDDDFPVTIGMPWPNEWMSTSDGKLKVPKASSSIAGGHEVWLWGYDTITGYFYGSNSWGIKNWSSKGTLVPKGCFLMPFAAIDWAKTQGGYDAHIFGAAVPEPPPEPDPTPVPTPSGKLPLWVAGSEDGNNWGKYKTR